MRIIIKKNSFLNFGFEKIKREVKEINSHKKFVQKKIEIFTTVTVTYYL